MPEPGFFAVCSAGRNNASALVAPLLSLDPPAVNFSKTENPCLCRHLVQDQLGLVAPFAPKRADSNMQAPSSSCMQINMLEAGQ